MAIHVRIRRTQAAALRRTRRLILAISISTATTLLLAFGITLFCVRFLIMKEEVPAFIAYMHETDTLPIDTRAPSIRDISSGAHAPLAAVTPSVIISPTASAVSMELMELDISAAPGLGTDAMGGLNSGFTPNSLGSGSGMGQGSGTGRRGGRKGLNDDIQIVLLLDASGSMDQLFTLVSESMNEFLLTLGRGTLNGRKAKVNVGIVCYGQGEDNGRPRVLSSFTQNIQAIRDKLRDVSCDGSEERCAEAIAFALERFPWNMRKRDDMLKVIFIAGNEPFEQGDTDYHSVLMDANQMNIIVNTIYCGEANEEWQAVAVEGRGVGFNIRLHESEAEGAAPRSGEQEIVEAAKALCACEIIPCGSPQERRARVQSLPAATKPPTRATHGKWAKHEGQQLVAGFDWDAAEICRREGEGFKLAMVGGLPNLPPEIRSMGHEGALEHIRAAAQARQNALEAYQKLQFSDNEFSAKALRVIRDQAAAKGIDMRL